jgi:hypothetical protein
VGTPQDVKGLTMAAGYAAHFIKVLEEDKNSKKTAVDLNTELGKLGNQIKAMQQRQQEQAKKAAAQNPQGGLPPEAQAKVAAIQATTQAKIQAGQQSHAQKTAQRQISFEMKAKQDQQKHQMELHKQVLEHGAELHKKNAEMANGKKNSLKSFDE